MNLAMILRIFIIFWINFYLKCCSGEVLEDEKLRVESKPVMKFLYIEPYRNTIQNLTVSVEIYSYPEANIMWYFTPCKEMLIHTKEYCNKAFKKQIDLNSIELKPDKTKHYFVTIIINFEVSQSGILTCTGENKIDKTVISTEILSPSSSVSDSMTTLGRDIQDMLKKHSLMLHAPIDEKDQNYEFKIEVSRFLTVIPRLRMDYLKYLLSIYKTRDFIFYWKRGSEIVEKQDNIRTLTELYPPLHPNSSIFDSNKYTFFLTGPTNFTKIMNVTISVESEVIQFSKLEPLNLNGFNKNWTATAEIYLFPEGNITWYFTPCKKLLIHESPLCNQKDEYQIQPSLVTIKHNSSYYFTNSTVNFQPKKSGILKCEGSNELRKIENVKYILVNNQITSSQTIDIKRMPEGGKSFIMDTIFLICYCHIFYNDLDWYSVNQNSTIKTDEVREIIKTKTKIENIITLKISLLKLNDSGLYECRCYKDSNNLVWDKRSTDLQVEQNKYNFWITDFIYIVIGIISLLITIIGSYIFYQEKIKEKPWTLLYDIKYEFPIDRLKIESELGSGAFGVVFEAIAEGILPNELETTVAVKTIKKSSANESTLRALESELEILLKVGKHLNIINLLGTVTKSNQRYRLMVIVEFCEYGNLKSFIFENKIGFCNEIDSKTGTISDCYDMEILSTNTLIFWSYQIAKGMEYVSQLNILHGDLAARNILLCDNNIIKICDFGLAKSMNYQYNYQTRHDTPLPVRWLAMETLECGILSTFADIWAFGILIWELFSLCNDPYKQFPLDRHVILDHLSNGYRLEKPKFCNNKIYEIMTECWKENPKERTSFTCIVVTFQSMLATKAYEIYMNITKLFNEKIKANNAESEIIEKIKPLEISIEAGSSSKNKNLKSTIVEPKVRKMDKSYYKTLQNSENFNENIGTTK